MMLKISTILAFVLITLFLMHCESNPVANEGQTPDLALKGVLIANEGNFQQGNASLSYYDADQGIIYNNVFKNSNQGRALGDVANSIYKKDSLAYIVVNNSDKIEVININNFKSVKTISVPAGSSPRNLSISSGGLIYVTSLYQDKVMVIDANSGDISGSIEVGANPDAILILQEFAYVTNSGFGMGNTISVIDLSTDQVVNTLQVGYNPQWIEVSATDHIHVLCAGAYNDFFDPEDDTPGGIWVIDPDKNNVIDSLVMAKGPHPSELSLSEKGKGYFLYRHTVLEYNTETLQVTDSTLIERVNGTPYHVRINDVSAEIYLCDAGDYLNPGEVYIYDLNGNEKSHHSTGIIPGYICFVNIAKEYP